MIRKRSVRAAIRQFIIEDAVSRGIPRRSIKTFVGHQVLDWVVESAYRRMCHGYRHRVRQAIMAEAEDVWTRPLIEHGVAHANEYVAQVVEAIIDNAFYKPAWYSEREGALVAVPRHGGNAPPKKFKLCEACGRVFTYSWARLYPDYCDECVADDEADSNADAEAKDRPQ